MIKVNGNIIEQKRFPDGTPAISPITNFSPLYYKGVDESTITWLYDGDQEIFYLQCIVDIMKRNGCKKINLYAPYLPNARMDRIYEPEENEALKVFVKNVINPLGLDKVITENVHSDASPLLINNHKDISPVADLEQIITWVEPNAIFFPDAGACKRYSKLQILKDLDVPMAFGIKDRDWKTGIIKGLKVFGDNIKNKNVLIIDDICSAGGTFYFSGEKLKEKGAKSVSLYVTHCEDNVTTGKLLTTDVISKIYTTDSICHVKDDKIKIIRKFR